MVEKKWKNGFGRCVMEYGKGKQREKGIIIPLVKKREEKKVGDYRE